MHSVVPKTGILAAVLATVTSLSAQPTPPGQPAPVSDAQPIPPRASANDYQAQTKVGSVTLAAEFKGHFVPAPAATYTTEDYVIVEAAWFGEPDAHLTLSPDQFSLRINGKKAATPAQS